VNQKILLVDNEPAALDRYRQMLESEFDIATAASGEEGLVSLRNHGPFAVVISDMEMVDMDGVQFLKRVRHVAPSTIRLLLTGHLDLNGAANAVNEGCVFRLLIKPCEQFALTEAITTALDSLPRAERRASTDRATNTFMPGRPRDEASVGLHCRYLQLGSADSLASKSRSNPEKLSRSNAVTGRHLSGWSGSVRRVLLARVRPALSVWQRMRTSGHWTCVNWRMVNR
jgi:CheY-like chemotaxis protein